MELLHGSDNNSTFMMPCPTINKQFTKWKKITMLEKYNKVAISRPILSKIKIGIYTYVDESESPPWAVCNEL